MLKYFAFIVCSLLFTTAGAQPFSYVYIQGDKETPFYVKFEGEMLPNFGNYYIISELDTGIITIEVLFQQNIFAPQTFTINVPESSFRGFLLREKNGVHSLYDIHRKFYIPAGNKAEDDDYLAHAVVGSAIVPADSITPEKKDTVKPIIAVAATAVAVPKVKTKTPKPAAKTKTTTPKAAAVPVPDPVPGATPIFMDNVELRSDRLGTTLPAGGKINKVAVVNSDCPSAISNDEFREIYDKAISKSSEGKLKYLLEKLDRCYTSNQIRQLATILPGDNERFTYLKRAYPKVTDQSAFERLENLLSTDEWKGYFRSLVQH